MKDSLKNWYQALSQREQILIGILVILLTLTVVFYGIFRPIVSATEAAENDYIEAIEREARIKSKVAVLLDDDVAELTVVTGSLDAFVSQSAGEAGFAIGTIDPQTDGSVNVAIASAKPTALFGWMARIEQSGVAPTMVAVTPAANGTVSANIRLSKIAR